MAHGQLLGVNNLAQAQNVGNYCRTLSPLSSVLATGTRNVEVVPSICVAERYDSNVFYAPSTPGLKRDDFVTTVNPMVGVSYTGDYASGYLNVGGFSETYVKNPDLNYLGTRDQLFLNLDNSIKRLFPNASLSVTDSFSYTPLPPGFVNPAAGTSPGAPTNIQNVYAQGISGFRTNNLINNGTVSTAYDLTASTRLYASYNHAILRFGSSSSTQGLTLFNSTSQTGTVGVQTQLNSLDTMGVRYSHTQNEFTPSSPSPNSRASSFITDRATIDWERRLTPNLSTQLGGGGIVINPGETTYTLNAALIMNYLNNSATITYARTGFPNFVGPSGPTGGSAGGVLIGDMVSLSATQRIALDWQLVETASYAHTSGGSGLSMVTRDVYFASVGADYFMTSVWSTALTVDYTSFNSQIGTTPRNFDRQTIMLSVRATWG